MNFEMRSISISFPKKTLEDLIAGHLYAVTMLNDDEDVELELKNIGETIPIMMNISKKKEVDVIRINGRKNK